ncbi:hypothetical protein RJO27_000810 [Enterobacter hormaechei]|nr:hypothetical protein [Enterobacter hormaechei]HAS0992505.1 hypothetical protein [Enterobacter hormaechei]HDT1376768.1 hypothetical protein [Enterobacter hormaechei subsp. xiangfangensis]
MNPSDIIRGFGRPVAYYPALAEHLGGVSATVLFCQMTYWMDKLTSDLGVHKTSDEIQAETGLSYEEQLTARKKLKRLGVLIETHKRLEHRIYFKVNFERVDQVLTQAIDNSPNGQNPFREQGKAQPGSKGIPCSGTGESPARGDGKAHFDPTEITTEITTENKTPSCPDAPLPDEPPTRDSFLKRHPEAVVFQAAKRQWGSQEDLTCAQWMWSRIVRLYEKAAETDGELVRPREPNWTAWANEIRLMRTVDGRTHKQICEMFSRVQRDPFWCRNVMSPSKLREKWDDLILRLPTTGATQHHAGGRDINLISRPDSTVPPGFRG